MKHEVKSRKNTVPWVVLCVWTKSGILGPTALVHEMPGKDYARAIHTHNTTVPGSLTRMCKI
jgi:hypothetical protein